MEIYYVYGGTSNTIIIATDGTKAGCPVTEEELADLKEVFEEELRIARERWDIYCKSIKK